jgi:hypothetical protein
MKKIDFKNSYYIKLGRGGKWEEASISENKLRLGWGDQTIQDINSRKWSKIRRQLRKKAKDDGSVTRDLNALQIICTSTPDDIWVTFYSFKLWWCRVDNRRVYEDKLSKYRNLSMQWNDKDIDGNVLYIHAILGTLSKTQGFRGTACKIKEKEDLKRLLNNEKSEAYIEIADAKQNLVVTVSNGISKLHWKDFEILTDLIFRQSGWQRLTTLGETLKYVDLELEDPITKDKYQVQVKSKASLNEFKEYTRQFNGKNFRKLYFVVHSPEKALANHVSKKQNIELVLPKKLAEMIVDLGLIDWVLTKVN